MAFSRGLVTTTGETLKNQVMYYVLCIMSYQVFRLAPLATLLKTLLQLLAWNVGVHPQNVRSRLLQR